MPDLGVDTVKQAEVFAAIRVRYDIPRDDGLKLRDYPTLGHVIGFVKKHRPDLEAAPAAAPAPVLDAEPAPVAGADEVTAEVLALVADKTGYPEDMLALDLDLDAISYISFNLVLENAFPCNGRTQSVNLTITLNDDGSSRATTRIADQKDAVVPTQDTF